LNQLDVRRIVIFLIVAFGIAWGCALIIYLTGGLVNSPQLIPGTGLTLALVLLAAVYMWAPALANIVTRLVTREGWRETLLRPNFRRGWPYWIAGWFGPAVLTVIGAGLFFVLLPEHFDSGLTRVADLLAQAGVPAAISPWLIIAGQTLLGILIAPLVNGLFTFGEEFGWRGYLQPKLMANYLGRVALAYHRDGAQLRTRVSRRALAGAAGHGLVRLCDGHVPGLALLARRQHLACRDRSCSA
jgi:membrane protease YdiL (CAAX protease family)